MRPRLTAPSTRRTRAAAAARPGFVDEYGGDHQEGGTLSPGETEAGIAVAGFPLADLTALEAGEAVTRTAAPLGPLPALCHATGPPEDGDCTRGLDFDVTITATREP